MYSILSLLDSVCTSYTEILGPLELFYPILKDFLIVPVNLNEISVYFHRILGAFIAK